MFNGGEKYHALLDDRIFFGGAADAEEAVTNEKIDVVVDLRVKEPEKVTYYRVHAPIADEAEQVEASILEAVDKVVSAYRDGKKFFSLWRRWWPCRYCRGWYTY